MLLPLHQLNLLESSDPVVAISGTLADALAYEYELRMPAAVVINRQTLILTLTNDTWVAAGAAFDAVKQGIIDGLVANTIRTNYLRRNQAIDLSPWNTSHGQAFPDLAVAPDGTMTADQLIDKNQGTAGPIQKYQNVVVPANSRIIYSFYAEPDQDDWLFLTVSNLSGISNPSAYFDLTNEAVGTAANVVASGIEAAILTQPNATATQKRCWITFDNLTDTNGSFWIHVAEANGDVTFATRVLDHSIFMWGGQVEVPRNGTDTDPTAYLGETTTANVTEEDHDSGWNVEVKDKMNVLSAYRQEVVRTSDTVVTVSLIAYPDYSIPADETITVTVPAAALVTSASDLVAPTTFDIVDHGLTISTSASDERDIRKGSHTLTLTLHGDTWQASGAAFDAIRQDIIDGIAQEVRTAATVQRGDNFNRPDSASVGDEWIDGSILGAYDPYKIVGNAAEAEINSFSHFIGNESPDMWLEYEIKDFNFGDFEGAPWLYYRTGHDGAGTNNEGYYFYFYGSTVTNEMWLDHYQWDAPNTYPHHGQSIKFPEVVVPDGAIMGIEVVGNRHLAYVDLNDGNGRFFSHEIFDSTYSGNTGVAIANDAEGFGKYDSVRWGNMSEPNGWNAQVKPNIAITDVVRTSDTVVTVTIEAHGDYDISVLEQIMCRAPATATVSGILAPPDNTITILSHVFPSGSSEPSKFVDASMARRDQLRMEDDELLTVIAATVERIYELAD